MTEDYFGGPYVDKAGRNGLPDMRANLTLAWDRGDWSAYYQYEYIASMYESSSFDVATLTSSASGNLDSHGIQNIQVSYNAPTDTTVTFGIRNINDFRGLKCPIPVLKAFKIIKDEKVNNNFISGIPII